MQADCYFTGTGARVSATVYIIYVPQGVPITTAIEAEALVQNHPEWIMAWRVVESGETQAGYESNRFTLTSRLKRNLNSGDAVYLLSIADNLASGAGFRVVGKCQFWTCAN